ncbi:MAG: hypothetical protein AAFU85_14080 [Planctomycetota bacterium]
MSSISWKQNRICLRAARLDASLAVEVYDRTCRTDFHEPGFCVVNLGSELDSHSFRRSMVDLKGEMARRHESATGKTLAFVWASRFDQQNSTKMHCDGGPEENFLMLGYEPSVVASELEIADYARCALDRGITPAELLSKHNPMFDSGYELLRPYITRVPCFAQTDYQIICINNSTAAYHAHGLTWQGTLHQATVPKPDETQRRIINSMMLASVPVESQASVDQVSSADIEDFIATRAVRRRGYDKQHLQDDE